MGQSRFPESGMKAVLEIADFLKNADKYVDAIEDLNKADTAAVKSGDKLQKTVNRTGRAFRTIGGSLNNATKRFRSMRQETDRAGVSVSRFASRVLSIQATISIVNSAFRAFENLGNAVGDLSQRAATIESVSRGFEQITSTIGGAEAVMGQLRTQSQGMVSDLTLMEVANVALINSTQEFADIVGENFGTVVQAAFAGAAATGQELDIVLEKVTRGLRRQSNLLLDDIGIWVTAEEANARYAASLGISVNQLTEAQKQAAFAAEAIRQMDGVIAASGFTFDSLAARIAQDTAQMANHMDQFAMNAQEGVAGFQAGMMEIGLAVTGALSELDPTPFFEGGANIIAALAEGILSGLTLVIQAITVVAQTIASFLSGLSPPPEGPLSDVDKGGQRMVEAWLSKFNDVSLSPVEDLSQNVANILAGTAALSTEQQIGVLEATQTRIQRRLSGAVSALGRGEGTGAEVRALDEQRVILAEQLRILEERHRLEQLFGESAAETQRSIARAVGGSGGGGTAGGQAEAVGRAAEKQERAAKAAGKAAKQEKEKEKEKKKTRRGAGGRAPTLPGGIDVPGMPGAGGKGKEAGPGTVGEMETASTRIERTLARVAEAIGDFQGVLDEASAAFQDIDLFGTIENFFSTLSKIESPQELIAFIRNLAEDLPGVPLAIIEDLAGALADITGIELPDWLIHGAAVALGMVVISQALGLIAGAVRVLIGALSPATIAIGAITLLFAFLEARAGSVEKGFEDVGIAIENIILAIQASMEEVLSDLASFFETTLADFLETANRLAGAALVVITGQFDQIKIEDGEIVLPDVLGINEEVARLRANVAARELQDIMLDEIIAVSQGSQLDFSQEVAVALATGDPPITTEMIGFIRNQLRAAMESGDPLLLNQVVQVAELVEPDNILTQQARQQLDAAIQADINAGGDLQVRLQELEIASVENVQLSEEFSNQVTEQVLDQVEALLSGSVSEPGVSRGTTMSGASSKAATGRSGGKSGSGPPSAVKKPGAGGGPFADVVAGLQQVNDVLLATQTTWENYRTLVTTAIENIMQPLIGLVTETGELAMQDLLLNANVIILSGAMSTFTGIVGNSLTILQLFRREIILDTFHVWEFVQAIRQIPRRISVIIDVTINMVNMTSIGNAIASAMADAGSGPTPVPGKARGGPFGSGELFMVGEEGPELIFSGPNSGHVIPLQAPPMPMNVLPAPVVMGGGTTISQTVNGPTDAGSNMRRMREMAALGVFG